MKTSVPRQRFEKALLELSRSTNIHTVFSDFLDYALLMVKWWDFKTSSFSYLDKRYGEPSQKKLFFEAYLAMADVADDEGTGFKDPFGDFYMEHMSNDRTGQFFTPESVCDLISQIQISELPEKGTVADPCCGSGRTLLSAAKLNRKLLFYGADIDIVCCKMTAINFIINTICGEVAWMNTITLHHWKSWHINKAMDGNGKYLPYYVESGPGETNFISPLANTATQPVNNTISPTTKQKIMNKWKEFPSSQLTFIFD
jgi:type I restriction-modification system DNA methylase subunit